MKEKIPNGSWKTWRKVVYNRVCKEFFKLWIELIINYASKTNKKIRRIMERQRKFYYISEIWVEYLEKTSWSSN